MAFLPIFISQELLFLFSKQLYTMLNVTDCDPGQTNLWFNSRVVKLRSKSCKNNWTFSSVKTKILRAKYYCLEIFLFWKYKNVVLDGFCCVTCMEIMILGSKCTLFPYKQHCQNYPTQYFYIFKTKIFLADNTLKVRTSSILV